MSAKKKITPEILRSWNPCEDGYKRFCELFPDGADLRTACVFILGACSVRVPAPIALKTGLTGYGG